MLNCLQLAVDPSACGLHKGALSTSFKSILRVGDFNIEKTRVRRSDDSGVVDDAPPEAPSPASSTSSSSSSSNLSAGATAGPTRATQRAAEQKLEKPPWCCGDKTQSRDDSRSGDVGGVAKRGVKSSLIATPLSVVENDDVSTTMSLAVTSGAQLTRNVVVVVKSTTAGVDPKRSAMVRNAVPTWQPTVTSCTPAATSVHVSAVPDQISGASSEIASPSKNSDDKPAADDAHPKHPQRSVANEGRLTQNRGLRRLQSSPCNLSAAAKETVSQQVTGSVDGRVAKVVVPQSQPAALKLTASSSQSGTSASGPISRAAVQSDGVVPTSHISDKAAAARKQHRGTPVETTSPVKNAGHSASSGDATRRAGFSSDNNSNCGKSNAEASEQKTTDLSDEGERTKVLPTDRCQVQPKASPTVRRILPNAVVSTAVGVTKISAGSGRSGCLVSERLSRRTTVLGLNGRVSQSTPPQAVQHTGPVISDVYESLRRRQEQEAARQSAQVAKVPAAASVASSSVYKSKQRRTYSARPKTGRSSVMSVNARNKQPPSRQPSAAVQRYRKPSKTPTSAVNSTAGVNAAKTPRGRKERPNRAGLGRRKRSKSSARKDESEAEPETAAGDPEATPVGGTGYDVAANCQDVADVAAAAQSRYGPSKNDYKKAAEFKVSELSENVTGSPVLRTSGRELSTTKAVAAAVGKRRRSVSSNGAEHGDSALATDVPKDRQTICKNQVPESTDGLSEDDGKPSRSTTSRRQSQSAAPACADDCTVATGVDVDGTVQVSTAAAVQPHRRSLAESPIRSSELDRDRGARLSAAVEEMMRPSRPPRRSRPAYGGGDVDEFDHDDKNVLEADATGADHHVSSGLGDAAAVVLEADVDRSPRFVRRHNSLVAAASCDVSRRASVEKTQGDGLGTLDADATLSWHNNNSIFDNSNTANDQVRVRIPQSYPIVDLSCNMGHQTIKLFQITPYVNDFRRQMSMKFP